MPSKNSLKRLGHRLADGSASEEDNDLLNDFIAAHHPCMEEISRIIRDELEYPNVSRLKTRKTLIEKLERRDVELPYMDDIAGIRLAPCSDRREQDQIIQNLRSHFSNSHYRDRRETPSSGYRACHLIVFDGDNRIEVQVRTVFQHRWAEIYEKWADQIGREVRYGGVPSNGQARQIHKLLQELADFIAELEEETLKFYEVETLLESSPPSVEKVQLQEEVGNMISQHDEREAAIREILDQLHTLV